MNLSSTSKNNIRYVLVAATILISLNLWSFSLLPENIYKLLEAVLLGTLIIALFTTSSAIKNRTIFRDNVILFLIIPVFSAFSALIFHDQPVHLSLIISRTNLFWLLYFLLHLFNIDRIKLINLILFAGIVWMVITIVQQFTYPLYLFSSREESDSYSILRSGVYRFMAFGHQYGTFVLFYCLYLYFRTKRVVFLGLVILSLVAFYYYGTRQFAIAIMICVPMMLFILNRKTRQIALVGLVLGGGVLYYFRDAVFQQYIELTKNQFADGSDIRERSAEFWLSEYWPHWMAMIFGNGRPHISSEYGMEMEKVRTTLKYYRSDVGIIGSFSEFGIFYVVNILLVTFKGLRTQFLLARDKYLVIIFLNTMILLITSQYFSDAMGIPFYCLVFYLFEKSYQEKYGFQKEHLSEYSISSGKSGVIFSPNRKFQ